MPEVAALKIHEWLDRAADPLNIGVGRIWKKGQLLPGLFSRYEWKCLAVIEKSRLPRRRESRYGWPEP